MSIADAQLSPSEQRRVTVWRVLVAAYVRVQARAEGKRPDQLGESERTHMLHQWADALSADFRIICDVLEQARVAGVQDTHSTLQRIDAQDPGMLDEAAAWAQSIAQEEERERVLDERDRWLDSRDRKDRKR